MTPQDETLQIDTPENVMFDYTVSGLGSRFLAALVDTLIISFIQLLVFIPIGIAVNRMNQNGQNIPGQALTVIIGLLSFIFFWGYYIFFEIAWGGQSPGKRWVGLRVIRTNGTPVTLTESLVRNLVRFVDFMPFGYGFGVISMFINEQSRRLGDLAAGTLVVHDRPSETIQQLNDRGRLVDVRRFSSSYKLEDFPVERVNGTEIEWIEEYLNRCEQMGDTQAEILARRIVTRIYQRLGIEEPIVAPRKDMLVSILTAVRAKQDESEKI